MNLNKLNKYTEVYNKKKAKIEEDTIILDSLQNSILEMVKTVDSKKLVDNINYIRYTKDSTGNTDFSIKCITEVRNTFIYDKIKCPINITDFDVVENKLEKVIQYNLCIKAPYNIFRVLVPAIDNIGVDDLISTNYGAYIVEALDNSYKVIDKISSYDTREIQNFIYNHIS